jgi:hypothetical protein
MKYLSITTAQNTYAVFVNRINVEEIEATIVSAWALTDAGDALALMPSQANDDPQLVPVEDNEKRLFKTFYFGNDLLNFLQHFQVNMRTENFQPGAEFHEPEVF